MTTIQQQRKSHEPFITASKITCTHNTRWNSYEVSTLIDLVNSGTSYKVCAAILSRPFRGIEQKIKTLRIKGLL